MSPRQRDTGRPRDGRVDRAIVHATQELLVERGYAALTVDAVASRAGVGKAAIYRRYATKQEMIFSATVHDMQAQPPPDCGSLGADLAALAGAFVTQLSRAPSDVLAGLLADIYSDAALGARFSETFLVNERLVVEAVLERAHVRGELDVLPDVTLVQALLLGPIFAWLLILDGDAQAADRLAQTAAQAVEFVLRRTFDLPEVG